MKWIKACLKILHGFIISIAMFGYETTMNLELCALVDGIDDSWPRTLRLKLFIVFPCMSNPYSTTPYAFLIQFNKLALIGDRLVYALSLIDIFSVLLLLKILELPLISIILPPLLWNELLLQVLVWLFDHDIVVGCLFNVDVVDPSGVLMLIFDLL